MSLPEGFRKILNVGPVTLACRPGAPEGGPPEGGAPEGEHLKEEHLKEDLEEHLGELFLHHLKEDLVMVLRFLLASAATTRSPSSSTL